MTTVYEVIISVCLLLMAVCAVPLNDSNHGHKQRPEEPHAKIENIYNEEDFQVVKKGFFSQGTSDQSPLAWTCDQRTRWRSLGEDYFPSRIREIECLSSTCWYNHYNCTTVEYSTLILSVCTRGLCNDHRVPGSLRHNWEFTNVFVQVGCMCTR